MDLSTRSGMDATRACDPAPYAIGGRTPATAVRPADRDELAEVIRSAARDRLGVVPWGGGVGLARMRPPVRYDLALDLRALDRIVAYEPEDLTLSAECGVTLATLAAAAAARGQELPLEGAHAARATLGGVLASNASGPRRLRFGSPRDRILGGHFVLGDGTRARTGGRVVKNVAGYAIHRLLCGSRGGLAVMFEATIKLAPAPHTRLAMAWGVDAATLASPGRFEGLARLEPAWWAALGADATRGLERMPAAAFTTVVGLEDDPEWVASQRARFVAALGAPDASVEGDDALRWSHAIADRDASTGGALLRFASAHVTPAALAPLLDQPEAPAFFFTASGGRLVAPVAPERATVFAACAHDAGFRLLETEGVDGFEPPLATMSAIRSLRAGIRDALDPGRVFAFGDA